jgi:hypothetical protein
MKYVAITDRLPQYDIWVTQYNKLGGPIFYMAMQRQPGSIFEFVSVPLGTSL